MKLFFQYLHSFLPSFLKEGDCLLCGQKTTATLFCVSCEEDLPRHSVLDHCPRCGILSANAQICGRCLKKAPHFDSVNAVFDYDFPVDSLIVAYKYGHRLALTPYFAEALSSLAGKLLEIKKPDVIIPLPLHEVRLKERGFNQALELGKIIAQKHALPLDFAVCTRMNATKTQANLPQKERIKNVRGAFLVARALKEQIIWLVDDVMTSGATANECARTLKLAGAKEVHILALARTQRKKVLSVG